MKIQVLFDGGMGEFPIKRWNISEVNNKTSICIDPGIICREKVIINIPDIKLLNTDNCINITIKGKYPTIIVDIYIIEEYEESYYTFCGYNSRNVRLHDDSFTAEYICVLHHEDHIPDFPF